MVGFVNKQSELGLEKHHTNATAEAGIDCGNSHLEYKSVLCVNICRLLFMYYRDFLHMLKISSLHL